jgi:hypothetical protein
MTSSPSKVDVPLKHPVTVEGKTYSTLTFRRMKARDALVGEGEDSEVRAGYQIFAALADVPLAVILDLDMEDMAIIGAKVAPLMGKLPKPAAPKKKGRRSPGAM